MKKLFYLLIALVLLIGIGLFVRDYLTSSSNGGAHVLNPPAAGAPNLNFQLNDYWAGFQGEPDVSIASDGSYMVAWSSGCNSFWCSPTDSTQDGSSNGVFAKRYAADGSELATPGNQGAGVGNEFQINSFTSGDQDSVRVVQDGNGNHLVVWASRGNSQDGSGDGIFAVRLDAQGNKLCQNGLPSPTNCPDDGNVSNGVEPEFRINDITNGHQRAPDVAMHPNGDFIVTWTDFSGNDGSGAGIFARMFDANANPKGASFIVNDQTSGFEAVWTDRDAIAMDANGNFVITWTAGPNALAKRYDANGIPQIPPAAVQGVGTGFEFQVSSQAGAHGSGDVAFHPNGDFVIAYSSRNVLPGTPYALATRFDSQGNKVCPDGSPLTNCPNDGNALNGLEPEFALSSSGVFAVQPRLSFNSTGEMVATYLLQAPHIPYGPFLQRFDASMNRVCADGQPVSTCPISDSRNGTGSELRLNRVYDGYKFNLKNDFVGNTFVGVWDSTASHDGEALRAVGQATPTRGDDTLWAHNDNCPGLSNPDQSDRDGNGMGDACNDAYDSDGDEYEDPVRDNCNTDSVGLECADIICGKDGTTTYCADNCVNSPNPDQADQNQDTYGDACQPSLEIKDILENAGNMLEADVRMKDPNGDTLSGSIVVQEIQTITLPASPFGSCDSIYSLDGVAGEGLTLAQIAGLRLLDADAFGGCNNGSWDYGMKTGSCAEAGGFGSNLQLLGQQFPLNACVQNRSTQALTDLVILSANSTEVVFQIAGQTVVDQTYSGALPNTLTVDGLGMVSGGTYLLTVSTTDGKTTELAAAHDFVYQGEKHIEFNKVIVCHDPAGKKENVLTIDESALQEHLDHGDYDGPCTGESSFPSVKPKEDIVVCHNPEGNNPQSLQISKESYAAHVAHGDTPGLCE